MAAAARTPTSGTDRISRRERRGKAPRTRRRTIVIRVLSGAGAVLVAAGIGTAWALNRYVIDHVEIRDVSAYEAEWNATAPTFAIDTTVDSAAIAPLTASTTTTTTTTSVRVVVTIPTATVTRRAATTIESPTS